MADSNLLDFNSIKAKLSEAGIHDFYEMENDILRVSESDAVRVALQINGNSIDIEREFPKIGNTVQIAITAVLVGMTFFVNSDYVSWGIAILLGQAFSYLYHKPKILKLELKVRNALGLSDE